MIKKNKTTTKNNMLMLKSEIVSVIASVWPFVELLTDTQKFILVFSSYVHIYTYELVITVCKSDKDMKYNI